MAFSCQVCEKACKTGWYVDRYCSWLSLEKKCHFCFHDTAVAHGTEKLAQEPGGRVIICNTHEVLPEVKDKKRIDSVRTSTQNDVELVATETTFNDNMYLKEHANAKLASKAFFRDIMSGNICIFIPGYFDLFYETRLTVSSISTFMPGVMVVIATHPIDYHVFHRCARQRSNICRRNLLGTCFTIVHCQVLDVALGDFYGMRRC